jgi:hypothetical protein
LGLSFSVLSNTVQGTIRGRVNTLQYTLETHITTKYEYIYCIHRVPIRATREKA